MRSNVLSRLTSGLAGETTQDRALGTDRDWEEWGKSDPYFGVLSSDEFHAKNLDEAALAKFFEKGEKHIDQVLRTIRDRLDKDFNVRRCADLGCGVGRLVIPLAGLSDEVVGIDVSESMLAEAQANCQKRQIENVSFVQSDDNLSRLSGQFNLVHSCLVLQHIPTARGMRILEALAKRLEAGGVTAHRQRCTKPDAGPTAYGTCNAIAHLQSRRRGRFDGRFGRRSFLHRVVAVRRISGRHSLRAASQVIPSRPLQGLLPRRTSLRGDRSSGSNESIFLYRSIGQSFCL
jgi:SAM-dependent methyltransferase